MTSDEESFFRSWTEGGFSSDIRSGASPRIRAFLNSVKFVHSHNDLGGHKVGLNRFSDLTPDELPLAEQSNNKREEVDWLTSSNATGAFIDLDTDDLIAEYAERLRRNRLQRKAFTYSTSPSKMEQITFFFSRVYTGILDSWWWIGGGHGSNSGSQATPIEEHSRHSHHSSSPSKYTTQHSDNFVLDKGNEMDGLQGDERKEADWERYLNWSTEDNPDGVAIVHEAMDQASSS